MASIEQGSDAGVSDISRKERYMGHIAAGGAEISDSDLRLNLRLFGFATDEGGVAAFRDGSYGGQKNPYAGTQISSADIPRIRQELGIPKIPNLNDGSTGQKL
ncbi:hypothetical protein IPL85_05185 [Candidatus Saccharibacteria bacterium]|nr:MAG: hypothetical protein IPL85_05185 [Candidatus Saccharibacteria bacterium]